MKTGRDLDWSAYWLSEQCVSADDTKFRFLKLCKKIKKMEFQSRQEIDKVSLLLFGCQPFEKEIIMKHEREQ